MVPAHGIRFADLSAKPGNIAQQIAITRKESYADYGRATVLSVAKFCTGGWSLRAFDRRSSIVAWLFWRGRLSARGFAASSEGSQSGFTRLDEVGPAGMNKDGQKNRRWFPACLSESRILRFMILLLLSGIVIGKIDLTNTAKYINTTLFLYMIIVQAPLLLSLAAVTLRHAILVRTPRAPIWPTFKAVVLSVGLNLFLPGRISELLKATYLRDHARIALSKGMAAVFLERLIDLVIVGGLAILSSGFLVGEGTRPFWLVVGGIVSLVLLILTPYLPWLVKRFAPLLPWRPLRDFVERFFVHASSKVRGGQAMAALALGLVSWLAGAAAIVLFLQLAGSVPLSVGAALAIFVATTLGGAVAALPGGLGTYEAAAVLALTGFGYGFEEAVVLAFAMHAIQFVFTLPGALVILTVERIGVLSVWRDALVAFKKTN